MPKSEYPRFRDAEADHLVVNLAHRDRLAQVKALEGLRERLRREVDEWVTALQAELVRAERSKPTPQRPSWERIGKALGVTGQEAGRRFRPRI
jgi:hypothetical protein